jgi:replicative superfamily II helicase
MEEGKFIIFDNNSSIYLKGTGKVTMRKSIYIAGTNTELNIDCIADFSNVPQEYHKIYYDAFVSEYYKTNDMFYITTTKKEESKSKEKSNIDKIVDAISNIFKIK